MREVQTLYLFPISIHRTSNNKDYSQWLLEVSWRDAQLQSLRIQLKIPASDSTNESEHADSYIAYVRADKNLSVIHTSRTKSLREREKLPGECETKTTRPAIHHFPPGQGKSAILIQTLAHGSPATKNFTKIKIRQNLILHCTNKTIRNHLYRGWLQ